MPFHVKRFKDVWGGRGTPLSVVPVRSEGPRDGVPSAPVDEYVTRGSGLVVLLGRIVP